MLMPARVQGRWTSRSIPEQLIHHDAGEARAQRIVAVAHGIDDGIEALRRLVGPVDMASDARDEGVQDEDRIRVRPQ